jgi:hypothetical protein
MSDDFQRGLQARLAHLIGEASQWSRGSGAHPPGLVKALNEALEYCCAEIERLQRERDALFRTACRLAPRADEIERLQRERDAVRTTDATLNTGLDQLRAIANGQVVKISPLQASLVLDYVRALAAKVASYERADRDLNEALNMGDGSYRP